MQIINTLVRNSSESGLRNRGSRGANAPQARLTPEQQQLLRDAAVSQPAEVLDRVGSSPNGLDASCIDRRIERYGRNEVRHDAPPSAVVQFLRTFANPFILILLFLAVVMSATDILYTAPGEEPDYTGVVTVLIMVLVSAVLRFSQEHRSTKAAEALKAMVRTTTAITRIQCNAPVTEERSIEEVVPGDIVELAAGDMLPADVRFLRAKDLQINQSMLTGESMSAEKSVAPVDVDEADDILSVENLGFMGTSVISGSGTAVVLGTGSNSYFGSMSSAIVGSRPETAFDIGIKKVSMLLIRFMVVMVPVVFIINGITKDWTDAFLFGVTTAVGLTPEMLPLIVTANLAKGAQTMSKKKVIVKRLNSIQNLGAMDILCTDKTGTLTEDRIVLERHLDVTGATSRSTLRYAAANAHFQTGLRNLLDAAIIDAAGPQCLRQITDRYTLIDEIPFDFTRRRMSVVLDDGLSHLIITKGAVEEILPICKYEKLHDNIRELTSDRLAEIDELVGEQNAVGMRVLAVAVRSTLPADLDKDEPEYLVADETDMTLVGFLSFLDPPKSTAAEAIESLHRHGVDVKVITGDNPLVAAAVCTQVGIDTGDVILGSQVEMLDDAELAELAERTTIFAKANPTQKARIVSALRSNGHTVGFLGDGINDAPALHAADVGISVDTAVDIAKESADFILLEKDLTVLEQGVLEGRRTFVNTMKYIKMTASSNFGNMFSVLIASAWLPFLPMIPIIVLIQNLSYDLSMLALPWDRVDDQDLASPRKWESKTLLSWMLRIGPISSVFDVATYLVMWFVFSAQTPADAALFQSGWFVESIISQTLIVHVLRTRFMPFVRSTAGRGLLFATGIVCAFGLVLPFTGWGHDLGLVSLPGSYFPWLVAILAAYSAAALWAKKHFIHVYGEWI